ncbi:MAG: hypothetical protein JST68_07100 [Bacteroidetes bacterium]|nr:hypothetical protein [Bacteroidota bacterium]
MKLPISTEKRLLAEASASRMPSVVITSAFEPKMKPKHELEGKLKRLLEQAEQQLMALHSSGDAMPVIQRLRQVMRKVDFSTHRRAIGIFVSPEVEKIYYLNMEVDTRVLVDENVRVRDLARFRRAPREFLVLVLDARQSRMYLGQEDHLRLIKCNAPQDDLSVNQFLYQMDHGLGAVLKLYPLPVFVIAPDSIAEHFSGITHNGRSIAGYVRKKAGEAPACTLLEYLAGELSDYDRVRERIVLQWLGEAAERGMLAQGLQAVARSAGSRNSRLLVVENGDEGDAPGFYKDGILDEIAEKVLAGGGEVESLGNGALERYGRVALILQR